MNENVINYESEIHRVCVEIGRVAFTIVGVCVAIAIILALIFFLICLFKRGFFVDE